MDTPETSITYGVQYQTVESGSADWFEMTGRNWDERRFRHDADSGSTSETTSMDEAVEIAEALVTGRSYPSNPRARHHRTVVASRVVIRIHTGQIAAVYGDPTTEENKAR
jgi:hypothetical protein